MRTRTNVSHRALATAESWAEAGYSVRHNAVGEEMWMDETHEQTAIYYTESEVRLNMYGKMLNAKREDQAMWDDIEEWSDGNPFKILLVGCIPIAVALVAWIIMSLMSHVIEALA